MAMPDLKCPKCAGEMDRGFSVDFGGNAGLLHGQWFPGIPQRPWWGSLFRSGSSIAWPTGPSLPISTFRCQACGYLESYAGKEFGPEE